MPSPTTRFVVEVRAELDGNRLRGHAAVFNQMAQLSGGWEQLDRRAFDQALKTDDVRALINHNPTQVLGRMSAGTLRLETDDDGLVFDVDLPDTSYARDLRELVARGDITGASFGFVPGEHKWGKAPDGRSLRTHTSVKRLLDVSPVTFPAYEGTDVALRSVDFSRPSWRGQLIMARHRALYAPKEG